MRTVTISEASRALIEQHANGNVLKPVVKVPGGYQVVFEDDVFEELAKWGPTIDEAIENVCLLKGGAKPS